MKIFRKHGYQWCAVIVAVFYFAIILQKSFFSDPIGQDEIRHLFTGVFYRDLLFSFPVESLREYAFSYYIHYPALGLLHWPPAFHVMEGLLFSIFGVHETIPRVLVFGYCFLGAYYSGKTVKLLGGEAIGSILAFVAFACFPIIFQFSQQIMLEVPAMALSCVSLYFFLKYLEKENPTSVYLSAFFAMIAMLTKGTTIFLIPLFGILGIQTWGIGIFKRLHLYLASIGFAIVMLAYNFVVAQFNGVRAMELFDYYEWNYLWVYVTFLWKNWGWWGLLLWLTASFLAIRQRKWLLFTVIVGGFVLVFLAAVRVRFPLERYFVNQAPFVAISIGMIPMLVGEGYRRGLNYALGIFLFAQFLGLFFVKVPVVQGYDSAARYLIENPLGKSVLINSYIPGNLAFYLRKKSPEPSYYLLPANKYFSYESPDEVVRELCSTPEEMKHLLDQYGVRYVLTESIEKNLQRIDLSERFMQMLEKDPDFTFIKSFPIRDTQKGDSELKLYLMNSDGRLKVPYFELRMGRLTEEKVRVKVDG